MRLGTSCDWAADLTTDDVPGLVWLVGEYGRRGSQVRAALGDDCAAAPPPAPVAGARARLALERLFRFFAGDRLTQDEYTARWGRAGVGGGPRPGPRAAGRGDGGPVAGGVGGAAGRVA